MKTSYYVDGYAPGETVPSCGMLQEPSAPSYGAIRRYADILNDQCFKRILGAERNKDALIEILRLLIRDREVTDIFYNKKKRKHNPYVDGHDAIFDVECVDSAGARFVVEMQKWEQANFYDRALFYSTYPIQAQVPQVKKGVAVPHDRQYRYPPVYVVSLMAFSLHPEDRKKLRYRFDLREQETGELMSDKLNFIFLEMDKVKKEPGRDAPLLEKFSWAMMNMRILRDRPAALVEKVFIELFKACDLNAYESEEQTQIIEAMTTERDKLNIAYTYMEKGRVEGRAEGEKKGFKRGRKEGRDSALRETAMMMQKEGIDAAVICRVTGLSIDKVEATGLEEGRARELEASKKV